mgnify:CR=1 FL=1
MTEKIKNIKSLAEYIKRNINLADFITTHCGQDIKMNGKLRSSLTHCPMPHHKDSTPSFSVTFMEEDQIWLYHCFGCNSGGTIIDFFMDYYGISSAEEAISEICNVFGLKDTVDIVISVFKDVKKRVDIDKKLECEHIIAANQCRSLLRKKYKQYSRWVGKQYRKMNVMLANKDLDGIRAIGDEISKKIHDKN